MNRRQLLSKPVRDHALRRRMTVSGLIAQMDRAGGFTARKLATALGMLKEMLARKDCIRFLSFPACIVATGTRGAIVEAVKRRWFDCLVTTCGTLDHDIARAFCEYYHGSFEMDDARLHRAGINRLGNVLVPNESYGKILERKVQSILQDLWGTGRKEWGPRELIREFGERVEDKGSILYWASRKKIPVYVPGITDGAFGSQLWLFRQLHKEFKLDLFRDEQELADIVFTAKRTGALMVGGGISKHHTIWWNQFRDGLNYAVYLTTAEEYDGSLSGARVREAVSWGKVREDASHITVEGDATVTLPLLFAALLDLPD